MERYINKYTKGEGATISLVLLYKKYGAIPSFHLNQKIFKRTS